MLAVWFLHSAIKARRNDVPPDPSVFRTVPPFSPPRSSHGVVDPGNSQVLHHASPKPPSIDPSGHCGVGEQTPNSQPSAVINTAPSPHGSHGSHGTQAVSPSLVLCRRAVRPRTPAHSRCTTRSETVRAAAARCPNLGKFTGRVCHEQARKRRDTLYQFRQCPRPEYESDIQSPTALAARLEISRRLLIRRVVVPASRPARPHARVRSYGAAHRSRPLAAPRAHR